MKKFRIWWDVGYGRTTEVIEAGDVKEAEDWARQAAEEEAAMNIDYAAEECVGGDCGEDDE